MARNDKSGAGTEASRLSAPTISLPKGGGAIRGIGEKFATNPVTGTGSMSVPIAVSPGRSGFTPALSLTYDSGAGNSVFGFGWALTQPQITRKTEKGLPQYDDARESDVYILSGVEDLVPVAVEQDGAWTREELPDRTVDAETYAVQRYRPRVEGLFARIERWTRRRDGDVHWRSISKDNILTLYGKDVNSRVADPADPRRVFTWFVCETRDDKGNAIVFDYKGEDGTGVDLSRASERNRGGRDDPRRQTNRYLKRVRYGNEKTLLDSAGQRPAFLNAPQIEDAGWMFEVVFDYGEHPADAPAPQDAGPWTYRLDPFSSYRAGFEVRTTRLCRRVLMFHHFAGEPGVGADCLVRSTDFSYAHAQGDEPGHAAYTLMRSVTQCAYKRDGGTYRKRTLPPIEYEYTRPVVQDTVHELNDASLANLPIGAGAGGYDWVDLHGEGVPGILTEQGGSWFYKRNVTPLSGGVEFAPLEAVALAPNVRLTRGEAHFMDLGGAGRADLVVLDSPVPGVYEHDDKEGWEPFRLFTARLNRDPRDPNLRFVDLDGDGLADLLISEDEAMVWHASLGEQGFGPAQRVPHAVDEEKGPRLIFADSTESIHLADLDGDGLTDLVRIRNGEVCYWPNLGYGRFGARVAMDEAPLFDEPDQFDQRRIRLADIDGSGTTDIIYLHRDGVRLYFNQSGNSWAAEQRLNVFPRIDDLASIAAVDLLGNGTACLAWSSSLPGDARRPMRYVDLMGAQKPHLLVRSVNNLGAETRVSYAPSTKFYLADRAAGTPWITKLPFPVHCVDRVTVSDKWRKTTFSTTYSYHHGFFDRDEREFRGFGRVERVDVESYGEFAQGNAASPYITQDKTLFQPPVKTVTWYHTGAALERDHVLSQFADEYFPQGLLRMRLPAPMLTGSFAEKLLPEPDLRGEDLDADEWREALRACKGTLLRQELYELDVDALERGEHRAVTLFSSAQRNCHIRRLQGKGSQRHAVFVVAESESLTYHYELNLDVDSTAPDPRVTHSLNLRLDDYGNVLQSVTAVYPRVGQFDDPALPAPAVVLVRGLQGEAHVAYAESRYTGDVLEPDDYRLRVQCESLDYELTGVAPGGYLTLHSLRGFRLSDVHQSEGTPVPEIPYHQVPTGSTPQKRLTDHSRTLFLDDATGSLDSPLAFGELGRRGLTFETYTLALSRDLLDAVLANKLTPRVLGDLDDPSKSGYLSGAALAARFPGGGTDGQYWIRSGVAGFAPDAGQHFFLPERFIDPFGSITRVEYDARRLLVTSTTDALGNTLRVERFDYRVLAPVEVRDINGNLSEVFLDVLGLPAAMALKGKGTEGDNLIGFDDALANPELPVLATFFDQVDLDEARARVWLGNASTRHVYHLGEVLRNDGTIEWAQHPACSCSLVRETHVTQLAPGEQSAIQAAFEYSDGMGSVLVKKAQAQPEVPGQPLRWVANGKTILNNKGNPVKQYEPYFSPSGHRFEEPAEVGVTPVIYYDALGRRMRTEMPDGTFSRVEFSPWHTRAFDANDTVRESTWYAERNPPDPAAPLPRDITGHLLVNQEQRAAWLVARHASTPTLTVLDSLGRDVVSVAHNRVKDAAGPHLFGGERWRDEFQVTVTKLDAEGKTLWIRDARGNLVMQYVSPPAPDDQPTDPVSGFTPGYDIAGNLLFQHSMDGGDCWMLINAAGASMFKWNGRGHVFRTEYDVLRRAVVSFATGVDRQDPDREIQFDVVIYGDAANSGLSAAETLALNVRGRTVLHKDTAGIVSSVGRHPVTNEAEAFDFKGNLLRHSRQLLQDYTSTPDWQNAPALEGEAFQSSMWFDALNRPIQFVPPHSDQPASTLSVIRPGYTAAGRLGRVDVWLEQSGEPTTLLNGATATLHAVASVTYDARGSRTGIQYGNGVRTSYAYDPLTFRLRRMATDRGSGFPGDWPQPPDPPHGGIQSLDYFYDPAGNVTHIADVAQQTVFFNGQRVEPSADYEYDALSRLVVASGRELTGAASSQVDDDDLPRMHQPLPTDAAALRNYVERYDYDVVGNILRVIHEAGTAGSWTRRYDYESSSNRLRATSLPTDSLGDFSALYQHDLHGNMTRMPHLPLMQWDLHDQLQATAQQVVTAGSPETTWYVYDASGHRVRKVTVRQAGAGATPTRMKERNYFGCFERYREYEANGVTATLERETLHVMDDRKRIALIETKTFDAATTAGHAPTIRYQLGNHLGSASLELDEHGQVISYEEFHPYGSTAFQGGRSVAEVSLKRYRFTGMERDEGTGFNYHGARYYAVWLGRWTSTDPAGITAGLNFYAYADDSPVSLVDPTGREPLTFEITDEQRLEALKHGQKIDPRQKTQTLRLLQKPKAKKAKKTGGVAGGEAGGVVGGDVGGKRGDQPHHGQDDQPKSDAPSQPGGDGPPKDPKDTGSGGDGEPGEGGTGSGAETKPGSPEGGSGKDQAEQGTGSGGGSGTGEGSGAKKKDGWLNLPDWVRTLLIVGLVVTAFLSVATFIRAVVTGFRVGGMLGATQAAATSTTATVTAVGGGGGATALIQNAPSVESILFSYRDQAVAHAQTTIDPNLPARRVPTSFGNLADARMKQLVQADIDSGALPSTFRVTANFQYGPDVFDTATGIGYDLTTATNLQVFKHDDKYIGSTVVFDGISYVVNDVLPLVYNR